MHDPPEVDDWSMINCDDDVKSNSIQSIIQPIQQIYIITHFYTRLGMHMDMQMAGRLQRAVHHLPGQLEHDPPDVDQWLAG